MLRPLLVLALIFWVLVPTAASAASTEERSRNLGKNVIIRGLEPEWATYQDFGRADARTSQVFLNWDFRVSELVDAKRSSMIVMLDGRPLLTRYLADVRRDGGVSLGVPGDGYRQVQFRFRLVPDEPVCGKQANDELWIELSEISATWTAREVLSRSVSEELQMFKTKGVYLEFPSSAPGVSESYLRMFETLRLGGHNVLAHGESEGGARRLRFALSQAATTPRVEVDVAGLLIVAQSAAAWSGAVQLLMEEVVLTGCEEQVCVLPEPEGRSDAGRNEPADHHLVASEFNFEQVGQRDIVLRGEGQLETRLPWALPVGWTLEAGSGLELFVDAPSALNTENLEGWVEVSLAGRPLESWKLRASEERKTTRHRLWVPLPADVLAAKELDVRVSLALRGDEERPCQAINSDALWLRLDPGSGLRLRGFRINYSGLSGLLETWEARPPVAIERSLSTEQLHALSETLMPIARRFVGESWKVVEECEDCIRVVASGATSLPLRTVARGNRQYWKSFLSEARVPEVAAIGSTLLARRDDSLFVSFSGVPFADSTWSLTPEPFALLRESGALRFGAVVAGESSPLTPDNASPQAAQRREIGEREQTIWLSNVLWIVVFLGLLGGAAWWVRRPLSAGGQT